MDENVNGHNTSDETPTPPAQRTAEEIAWDQEFRSESVAENRGGLKGVVKFATRLPGAIMDASTTLVPDETTRHTRAAVREGFLALRSLLGAIGDGIEDLLAEPSERADRGGTVKGPQGTWGTGRAAGTTSSARTKRISLSDDESGDKPTASPGDMP